MADPKITLTWTESNTDETGQQVFITTEPWNRGAAVTKIKDVDPDITTVDLTLAEVTIEPGFLQVAAVRGAETKMSKEYALAIKTPVVTGAVYNAAYGKLGELPNGVAYPAVTKGTPASYPFTYNGFSTRNGYTVTPEGKLLQIYNKKARTLDLTTGEEVVVSLPSTFDQIGSGICMASDGNAYIMGRVGGDIGLFKYTMDGEAPVLVATWAYSSGGQGSPACIKQGKDERIYMFGGYNGITSSNELVVNSVNLDGTDPRSDALVIPVTWGSTGSERMLYTPDDKIVVWAPGKPNILVYDPLAAGGATVTAYAAGSDLSSDAGTDSSSNRTMVPQNSWAVLIQGKGRNICQFMYEDNASWVIQLPSTFVDTPSVNNLYDSIMGWLFVSNTAGAIHYVRLTGQGTGATTLTPAEVGMTDIVDGPDFVRIGKTVYAFGNTTDRLLVCPFHIDSKWQSTGAFDAASLANTNARNQNGSN